MSVAESLRKAGHFSGFLKQRILMLRRFDNHPSVLSTTEHRAKKLFSPGIVHSSPLGKSLLRQSLTTRYMPFRFEKLVLESDLYDCTAAFLAEVDDYGDHVKTSFPM
jgi:hypothetical protein